MIDTTSELAKWVKAEHGMYPGERESCGAPNCAGIIEQRADGCVDIVEFCSDGCPFGGGFLEGQCTGIDPKGGA